MARKNAADRYLECGGCRASVPTVTEAKSFGWKLVDNEWLCDACGYAAGNCGDYDDEEELEDWDD